MVLSLVLLLLAFFIGTLPLGHWLLSRAGVETRLNNPHNLGVENLFHRIGPTITIGSATLDALKGFLAVLLASEIGSAGLGFIAALFTYWGHLNPPKLIYGQQPPRGRGNLVLFGILTSLAVTGSVPFWATLIPIIIYAAVTGYFGFISAGTLSALLAFMVTVNILNVSTINKLAIIALFFSAIWRFKENIGRILDGTEPRIGDEVPLVGKHDHVAVTAFMIHPMNIENFWEAKRFGWLRPLVERGLLSEHLVRKMADEVRPMKVGEIRGIRTHQGKEIHCYLLSSPLLPDRFRDNPELATQRAIEGAKLAQELGAEVFGLGAFWSVIGNKGLDIQKAVPDITITNGGAYTSGTIKDAIPGILEHFKATGRDLNESTAAVVGANGVVAFGIARTIAPQVKKLIMLGRDLERLDRSANTLQRANKETKIVTTTSYEVLKEAEIIFTATSDPNPVIFPEHVQPGTWIFDEGRPADVDESVKQIAGIRIIPGGVVKPPGSMYSTINLQFGEGSVPACLAETLIIAATGDHERKSLGAQTKTDNIQFFVDQAQKLGFEVLD